MKPSCIHQHRLCHALALVVAGTLSDRIDVAEVVFGLWMDERVSVHLGRARVDDPAASRARVLDEAQRAKHARGQRCIRIGLVVHRGRRAGQVKDDLGVGVKRLADVTDLEMKSRVAVGVLEVAEVAGHQIIEADDLEALSQEPIDEVRADEAGRSCYQHGATRRSQSHGGEVYFKTDDKRTPYPAA